MSRTRISTMFPSKYLKPGDLKEAEGGELELTITSTVPAELPTDGGGNETKWVVNFKELDRGWILNRTNADRLAELFESDLIDDWVGQRIRLYVAPVMFKGEKRDGIRVKAARQQPSAAALAPSSTSEIPF